MTIAERARVAGVACVLASFGVGCGAPKSASDPSSEAGGRFAHVAAIHKSKCGACHARVEPGTRSRAVLEAEMKRHRSRVKLSERDWTDMIDYLAGGDAGDAPSPTAAP